MLVRLVALLAGAAFIAVLSLVAAPGSAGSRTPSRPAGVDPALLQPLLVRDLAVLRDGMMPLPFGSPTPHAQSTAQAWARDGAWARDRGWAAPADGTPGRLPLDLSAPVSPWSEGAATDTGSVSVLEGGPVDGVGGVFSASRGQALPSWAVRPTPVQPAPVARQVVVLHGIASWYDNGTTAMRWARGARVRICGPATCVNRVVTDWGPDFRLHPDRVVDLMPSDFVRICGCSLRIGLTEVTVEIVG